MPTLTVTVDRPEESYQNTTALPPAEVISVHPPHTEARNAQQRTGVESIKGAFYVALLFISTTLPVVALFLIANFIWLQNAAPSWELHTTAFLAAPFALYFSLKPLFWWLKRQEQKLSPLHGAVLDRIRSLLIIGLVTYGLWFNLQLLDNKIVTHLLLNFFHPIITSLLLFICPVVIGAISFLLVHGLTDLLVNKYYEIRKIALFTNRQSGGG